MPKVTRKDAAAPLQEVGPSHMEEDDLPVASISGEPANKPSFPALSAYELNGKMVQFRRVPVPQHRMTPLKTGWLALYKPVTQNLKLDMRMNLKTRKVRRGCVVEQDFSLLGCLGAGGIGAGRQRLPARTPTARGCGQSRRRRCDPSFMSASLAWLCQVEIKTTDKSLSEKEPQRSIDLGNLQRAADFVHAFILGEMGWSGGGLATACIAARFVGTQSSWAELGVRGRC